MANRPAHVVRLQGDGIANRPGNGLVMRRGWVPCRGTHGPGAPIEIPQYRTTPVQLRGLRGGALELHAECDLIRNPR